MITKMIYNRLFFLCVCILFLSKSTAQQLPTLPISLDSSRLDIFRDTIFDFAFDSLTCHMVNIPPRTMRITKKFKYLGDSSVFITRAWTGDPHFICGYPNEPLLKGKVYTFKVCFAFEGREGAFDKTMGFNLSNDKVIAMRFLGTVAKKE